MPVLILILTGLPRSAVMGEIIYSTAQDNEKLGYAEQKMNPPTSDIDEIPWATGKNDLPKSNEDEVNHEGHVGHTNILTTYSLAEHRVSIDKLHTVMTEHGITKPYSIVVPSTDDGVFVIAKGSGTGITGLDVNPKYEMTNYFDQYSGQFISEVNYKDYAILAQLYTWGIPLHEGHLFGWANKVINLVVCILFLAMIFIGFRTWLLRRKKDLFLHLRFQKDFQFLS